MTVHAITSLTALEADPVLLAAGCAGTGRSRRCIGSGMLSFDEDRFQVCTGNGPQTMAALRNLVITALRLAGVTNIAAALCRHGREPHRPLGTYEIA